MGDQEATVKNEKVHFHLYLDTDTADWLRQEKKDNYMPISATVALAVRDYRKKREEDAEA